SANPALARRLRLTTSEHFHRFVSHVARKALADRATDSLGRQWPELSAAPPRRHMLMAPLAGAAGIVTVAATVDALTPAAFLQALPAGLAALFIAWLGLRIAAAAMSPRNAADIALSPDHALPIYTVICALYREAASVRELLAAIDRLDYPREKLQVI